MPPGIPLALPEDAQLTSLVMTKHIQNFLTSDTALISEVGMEPLGMNGMQRRKKKPSAKSDPLSAPSNRPFPRRSATLGSTARG